MAQIDLNLGTSANSNDGDSLRDAMQKIQTNTTEIYAKGVTPLYATLSDLPSASDHHGMFAHVHATGAAYFAHNGNWVQLADTTSSANIANGSIDTIQIADDAVTHAKLENRYTEKATSSSTGTQNLDAATASVFLMTGAMSTATLTIQNLKLGQTIDIVFLGSMANAVLTLDTDYTTDTFYRVGAGELDTAEPNIIQITCVDDTDNNAKIAYSINKFESGDTTP
jgi:hypothetical protein